MKMNNVLKITKSHFSIEKICLKTFPCLFGVILLVSMSDFFPSLYKAQSFVIYTTVFAGCVPIGIINRIASYDKKQGVNINNIEYSISLMIFAVICFSIGVVPFAVISGFVGKALAVYFAINFFGWIVSSIIGLLVLMSERWRISLKFGILGVFLLNIINYVIINYPIINYPFNINSTFISKIMTGYYVERILSINNDLYNNHLGNIPFATLIIVINLIAFLFAFLSVYRKKPKQ